MTATLSKSIRKHIFLHPADKHRKQNAIKAALLKDKKKHSDRLGGALLDVDSLKVVGDRHLLVDGYLSMEVLADVQVFAPTSGMCLEGVINKCSKTHIGCLVLDTFNAILSNPKGLAPEIGDGCVFTVTDVVVDDEILFLRGRLNSVEKNHLVTFPEEEEEESTVKDMSRQKATTATVDEAKSDHELSTSVADSSITKKRSKKNHGDPEIRTSTVNVEEAKSDHELSASATDSSTSKKRSKKRKRKSSKNHEDSEQLRPSVATVEEADSNHELSTSATDSSTSKKKSKKRKQKSSKNHDEISTPKMKRRKVS